MVAAWSLTVYNPTAGTWSNRPLANNTSTFLPIRIDSVSVLLQDSIYAWGMIIGGDSSGNVISVVNLTTFSVSTVQPAGVVPPSRAHSCAVPLVSSNSFMVIGGDSVHNTYGGFWIYFAGNSSWTQIQTAPQFTPRAGVSCASIGSKVYVFGGQINSSISTTELWLIDVSANPPYWSLIGGGPAAPSPRNGPAFNAVGKYLVMTGGLVLSSSGALSPADDGLYVFDTSISQWISPPSSLLSSASSSTSPIPSPPPATSSATSAASSSSSAPMGAIIGGAVGGAVVLAAVAFLLYRCGRRNGPKPLPTPDHAIVPPPAVPVQQYDMDDIPPIYKDSAMVPEPRGNDSSGDVEPPPGPSADEDQEEVKIYRGLCSYEPRKSDEVAVKLGDEIVIRRVFGDGWVLVSNLTTKRDGIAPVSSIDVGKDLQYLPSRA
ncbi:hypothetical protein BDK51DRAFT_51497 [Blyttiomyces helicus]|uniref:SH3 domain-containing protein n=1 Tax=Blyttiomyces helicus TaxID=388810 RepID=A0A4P9VTX6_9FUNG|nr:hypothetical protein BDK51DRAFT_51497 [Blyttiomyces helicus]|eukprot:RKO82994.1 hypothetical protein BDK51DRAFT_51497 [Blyttiomyces helicus]